MTNPYEPSRSPAGRRDTLKGKLAAFGKSLTTSGALLVLIPVSVIHFFTWMSYAFHGSDGGNARSRLIAAVLGLPLSPLRMLPGGVGELTVFANSFLWAVAVLCFLRGIRGMTADGRWLDEKES